MHETFWSLFCDPAHWLFELFLMAIFDGLIGCLAWPYVRKHWLHHIERDKREGKVKLNAETKRVLCRSNIIVMPHRPWGDAA